MLFDDPGRRIMRALVLAQALLLLPASACGQMSAPEYFEGLEAIELATAVQYGDVDEIRRLVGDGANPNTTDIERNSLLDWAVRHDQKPSFGALLELGADPNLVKPSSGSTILHRVAVDSDADWLRIALASGADPNARDNLGRNALFKAVSPRSTQNIDLLLEHGADIDRQDVLGQTVVMYVAILMRYDLVLHLLQKGASPSIADEQGNDLAALVQERVPASQESEMWRQKVIRFLKQREFSDAEKGCSDYRHPCGPPICVGTLCPAGDEERVRGLGWGGP